MVLSISKPQYLLSFLLLLLFINHTKSQQEDLSIMLHVIPHTHLDAGWIESYDTYYEKLVYYILNNLLESLEKDPILRFNWSEISFLSRWWAEQDGFTKKRFKALVDRG